MSVTTTQPIDIADFHLALGSVDFSCQVQGGAAASSNATKVLSSATATDDQISATLASYTFVNKAANQATLQQRAQAALTANANYLALATPNAGQVAGQIQLLTKECSALIRLLLGLLDSTAGA